VGANESFWIVPLRSSRIRVHGPYESLRKAQEAGTELIVAVNMLKVTIDKVTIDDEPTLEVVDFIRNKYAR
jgi:hypothetical protein